MTEKTITQARCVQIGELRRFAYPVNVGGFYVKEHDAVLCLGHYQLTVLFLSKFGIIRVYHKIDTLDF